MPCFKLILDGNAESGSKKVFITCKAIPNSLLCLNIL